MKKELLIEKMKGEINMEQIHGGNIEEIRELYDLKGEEIIDFSANINFIGPPSGLIARLKSSMEGIIHYPEAHSTHLQKQLADFLNIAPEKLIVSNGSVELIYQIVDKLKPEITLLPVPSFFEYEAAVKNSGGKIRYLYADKEREFKFSLDKIINNLKMVDLLFLCNPNNPTGSLIKAEEINKLLTEAAQEDVFVIIDEAFIDFVKNRNEYMVINLIHEYSNLFILRSMTKFYAIPGLRLGYGIGSPDFISLLEENRDPWSVNFLAQKAGEFVLKKDQYREETKRKNRQERNYLYNELEQIENLSPYIPAANFIFIDISGTGYSAAELTDILIKKKILIRNCDSFQGLTRDYIRVAVKNRHDNCKLINAFTDLK